MRLCTILDFKLFPRKKEFSNIEKLLIDVKTKVNNG